MNTLQEDMREGIGEMTKLRETVEQEVGRIRGANTEGLGQMDAKKAELAASVSGYKAALESSFTQPRNLYFDRQVQSKASSDVVADPADATVSLWQVVPNSSAPDAADVAGHLFVPFYNKKCVIEALRLYSYSPGHYEGVPYATDESRSFMQFLVASTGSDSEAINQAITEKELNVPVWGGWNVAGGTVIVPCIYTGSSYASLYVRYINKGARVGDVPQNISERGGNAFFAIDAVKSYNLEVI